MILGVFSPTHTKKCGGSQIKSAISIESNTVLKLY